MGIGRAAPAHGAGGHGQPGPATISLTAAASAYGVRRSLGYLTGLIVGTVIVLVAVAVATGITATTDAAAKIALLNAMIVLVLVAWLIAGACLASLLRDPARARIINTALGALR